MRLIVCLALLATPALASSDDAWTEFRVAVETACRALVQDRAP